MWQYDPSGQVIGMSMPLQNVSVGQIVQMRLVSGYPHTAIVYGKTSSGVVFVESNWDSTPLVDSDAYVRTRSVTYAQFYAQVSAFSVYDIK